MLGTTQALGKHGAGTVGESTSDVAQSTVPADDVEAPIRYKGLPFISEADAARLD